MSNKNRQPPCDLPTPNLTEEQFPPLSKPKETLNITFSNMTFKRFVTIEHQDKETDMSHMNPFEVDRQLRSILGKKHRCKVTNMRSGHLLVEVDQRSLYDKLLQVRTLGDIPVVIKDHKQLNSSKGRIYCENLKGMTKAQILDEMDNQDVTDVYRIEKREGNEHVKTHLYIITFDRPSIPKEVKIGFNKCEVALYIPNPRRCFNCQRYGHASNNCQQDTRCVTCGKKGHERGDDLCDKIKKCYHCEQGHESSSRECPQYKLEKIIIEDKTKNNLTFKQARDRTYSTNPHLVSLIPRLQNNNNKRSYKTVTAQPTEIATLQLTIQKQQKQISTLTEQISKLLTVIDQQKLNLPIPPPCISNPDDSLMDVNSSLKRSLHRESVSSEDEAPSSKRAPSFRQEGKNLPDSPSHQDPPESDGKGTAPTLQVEGACGGISATEEIEVSEGATKHPTDPPTPPENSKSGLPLQSEDTAHISKTKDHPKSEVKEKKESPASGKNSRKSGSSSSLNAAPLAATSDKQKSRAKITGPNPPRWK